MRVLVVDDMAEMAANGNYTVRIDPAFLRGFLDGYILGNNATDANNDIDFAAGLPVILPMLT